MLNFGYLNLATCFYYDVDNNLIVMFSRLQARILMFNRFTGFWPTDILSSLRGRAVDR